MSNPFHDSRISDIELQAVVNTLEKKKTKYTIITDWYTIKNVARSGALIVNLDTLDRLESLSTDVAVLAIDCDQLGKEVVKILREKKVKFVAPGGRTARYLHIQRAARNALYEEHDADEADDISHFNDPDFCNIAQVIDLTAEIPGDYVEVGTFNGASARFALRYMDKRNVKRRCFFMDTFTGFDYEAAEQSGDAFWHGSHVSHGIEAVAERLAKFETKGRPVTVRQVNIITDELPDDIGDIAVANLDVDIHEGIVAGLEKLAGRIVPGGFLIAEDAGHTPQLLGARLALDEFLERDDRFLPIYMESGQTLLYRKP